MSLPVAIGVAIVGLIVVVWLARRVLERWARRTVLEFRARLDRYKLVERRQIKTTLLADPMIGAAITKHADEHGLSAQQVTQRVGEYIDEIVPFFNVLSYYKVGYNLSKLVTRFFYNVTIEYQDSTALERLPRRDVVVYVMNHRSNIDYVVVTYVLARVVSISYAVGEWARTWPLEYIFKSFGSYFIRRRFRELLYHAVLERYVQLITKNRVTQGIFPEGGLTRDGTLRPPKIGLFDYIVRTIRDPEFDGDIWIVPVGINYDQVLEDRTLTRELVIGAPRRSYVAQLAGWVGFALLNLGRFAVGQGRRYGRCAVTFGTPVSVRSWFGAEPDAAAALDQSKGERLAVVQRFAQHIMAKVGAILPVTPVPLAAAALLSFPRSLIPAADLMERLDQLRDRLSDVNAKIVRSELPVAEVWDRAWRTFRVRRWVHQEGSNFVILPNARPLLEYYANSIAQLMPETAAAWHLSPAEGPDESMPRLGRQGTADDRRAKRA